MHRTIPIIVSMLICLLSASSAHAQFFANDNRQEFISLSTTTTTAVAVGVIMLTVANVRKDPTALQRYLRDNEPAVRAAMSVGGGEVVEDLAGFFDLAPPQHDTFATLLRHHRRALTTAAYEERDIVQFAQIVWTAITYDRRFALQ